MTAADVSQSSPPLEDDSQEVRGRVFSVTDEFGREEELCTLPGKTQEDPFGVGDGGGDPSDPGDPTKEEEKPEALPHRREEDALKGKINVGLVLYCTLVQAV